MRQQVAVFRSQSRVACIFVDGGAKYDLRTPSCAEMILGSIKDRYENTHDSLRVRAISRGEGGFRSGTWGAAGEKGSSEIADGGDDDGEVIASIPETIVGGLVAEDLGSASGGGARWW